MLKIHATKKLFARLPLDEDGFIAKKKTVENPIALSPRTNPLSNWHANLLTLQRRNCVILVHDETRFPLFIKSLVKADFAEFDWHFSDALMNTLLKLDANQQQLDAAVSLIAPCQFDSSCDRSVQGTMNHMKFAIENMLWYDNVNIEDVSTYRTGAWLAHMPCGVKGSKDYIWPDKAMLDLLSNIKLQTNSPSVPSDNVVNINDFRR